MKTNIMIVAFGIATVLFAFAVKAQANAYLYRTDEVKTERGVIARVMRFPEFGGNAGAIDFILDREEELVGVTIVEPGLYQMRFIDMPQWLRELREGDEIIVLTYKNRFLRIDKLKKE